MAGIGTSSWAGSTCPGTGNHNPIERAMTTSHRGTTPDALPRANKTSLTSQTEPMGGIYPYPTPPQKFL